jgi:hypothetical protein
MMPDDASADLLARQGSDEKSSPAPGMSPGVATNSGGGNTSGAGPTLQPPSESVPGAGIPTHPPTAGPIHPEVPGEDTTPKPVNEWMQDA